MATADLEQVRVFRPDKSGERIDVQGSRGTFHFRSPLGRFVTPFPEEVAIAVNGRQNGNVRLRVQKFQPCIQGTRATRSSERLSGAGVLAVRTRGSGEKYAGYCAKNPRLYRRFGGAAAGGGFRSAFLKASRNWRGASRVLAGHPQTAQYGLTLVFLYAIMRGFSAASAKWRYYAASAIMIGAGLVLRAIQILPTAETAGAVIIV